MKSLKIRLWKKWHRFLGKVIRWARKRNVINHANYSRFHNRVVNWAYRKQRYAQAYLHDLECKCGRSEVEHLKEIEAI